MTEVEPSVAGDTELMGRRVIEVVFSSQFGPVGRVEKMEWGPPGTDLSFHIRTKT